jgi:hypothetical protein
MRGSRLGMLLAVVLGLLALLAGGSAFGDTLSDGSLSVEIETTGDFGNITLNGINIDTSATQENVSNFCDGFFPILEVMVTGTTATSTATCGPLDVTVISRILGALASDPNSNVLEQELIFTNTGEALQLVQPNLVDAGGFFTIVSAIHQALNDDPEDDTVEFVNADTRAVVATDDPQLMAAIASIGIFDTTFGFDVDDDAEPDMTFPLGDEDPAGAGDPGPEGPGDTSMSLGFNGAMLAPGESGSVFFRYLFSTNASMVPADFAFPPALTVERGANSPDPNTQIGVTTPVEDLVLTQLKLTAGAERVVVQSLDVRFLEITGDIENFEGRVKVIHDIDGNGQIDPGEDVLAMSEVDIEDDGDEGALEAILTLIFDEPVLLEPNAMTHLLIAVDVSEAMDLAAAAPLALPKSVQGLGWLALLPSALGLILVRRMRRRFPRFYLGLVLVALLCSLLLAGCPDGNRASISFTGTVPEGGVQGEGSNSGPVSSAGEQVDSPMVMVDQ